jgi:hypothetical protein
MGRIGIETGRGFLAGWLAAVALLVFGQSGCEQPSASDSGLAATPVVELSSTPASSADAGDDDAVDQAVAVRPVARETARVAAGDALSSPTVPGWAADAIFYQIFPERFANGDPSNDPTRESLESP